jgi:8-oxo-dGTP diphosphatase
MWRYSLSLAISRRKRSGALGCRKTVKFTCGACLDTAATALPSPPVSSDAARAEYRNSRPAKRMGAGAVLRDAAGRVLVVQPTYKPEWEIPGGSVELDESPRAACLRELAEELGLTPALGRMLCMEWQGPEPERTESLMFVYDGGVIKEEVIRLAPDELCGHQFVAESDLDVYLTPRLARRVRAALTGLREDRLVEMEHGLVAVGSPPVHAEPSGW